MVSPETPNPEPVSPTLKKKKTSPKLKMLVAFMKPNY